MEFELGNFEQAIQYYAKLDNRDLLAMTGVSTYERIGKAYASLGKFEAAREFLEKAIEIEYDDTIAFELATLLYDQEEYQKANFYFKQIEPCLLTSRVMSIFTPCPYMQNIKLKKHYVWHNKGFQKMLLMFNYFC